MADIKFDMSCQQINKFPISSQIVILLLKLNCNFSCNKSTEVNRTEPTFSTMVQLNIHFVIILIVGITDKF